MIDLTPEEKAYLNNFIRRRLIHLNNSVTFYESIKNEITLLEKLAEKLKGY